MITKSNFSFGLNGPELIGEQGGALLKAYFRSYLNIFMTPENVPDISLYASFSEEVC